MKRVARILAAACEAITVTSLGCVGLAALIFNNAEPEIDVAPDDEPVGDLSDWCPRCGIHRVRQDHYGGTPVYVDLCPVCVDAEQCDWCGEPIDPDARCTHGRELCAQHLATGCRECAADFLDDASAERWRLM